MTNRKFKDAGFNPILAYVILTLGFVGLSILLFHKTGLAAYLYLLFAMILMGGLSETRRNEFLKHHFGDKRMKAIRIMENLMAASPFVIFLLVKQYLLAAGLLLITAPLLALANFRTRLHFTIWTPFSKKPFEFTIGFRNTFYLFFIAYALTGIAVFVNNFNLGIFALMLVFVCTLSYYAKPENEYYVWIFNIDPQDFLVKKITTAMLFSTLLALPIMVTLSIGYPQNIGFLLFCLLLGWVFLMGMIVSKYAAYPNDIDIQRGILLALCIAFPPLFVILIPYLFNQSKNRLSSLLK